MLWKLELGEQDSWSLELELEELGDLLGLGFHPETVLGRLGLEGAARNLQWVSWAAEQLHQAA